MAKYELDLVNGSIFKNIFIFSIPLIFSNILQSLFNIADVSIVGHFAGAYAIGAVGSTTQFIWFFTGLISGIASAGNVMVAYYVGAKSKKDVEQVVFNSFIVCITTGIFLMFLGSLISKPVLILMKTKSELISDATIYFRIYMLGLPAVAIYNFGNCVLSAVGDTKRPVIYLSIAGILNIILDFVTVYFFKWGVAGVAFASSFAQWVSAFLILIATLKGVGDVKLILKNQTLSREKILRIVKIGLPAGLQCCIFSVANMFIQSCVNSFDAFTVSGCAAADKADGIAYNILFAFYAAGAAFIGQNYGAKKKDRIIKSYLISIGYALFFAILYGILIFVFGPQFLSIFTKDINVIDAGMTRLKIMAFSYWISVFMDGTISASRGLGKTSVPTIIVILGSCVFRLIWIYTVFALVKTIPSLFLLYPFSWIVTATAEIIYFVKIYKKIEM